MTESSLEERLLRVRYAHGLTGAVFTPDELAIAQAVDRRAAVWVPTATFAATMVSAVAAVVLATRLRPRGRMVRTDVADAYEAVRDAPRRLVRAGASAEVLGRVAGLFPVADQLVGAIAAHPAGGGVRVEDHPAYERIVRMRAEVEALETLLDERAELDPVPAAAPVPFYRSLGDLADLLEAGREEVRGNLSEPV